MFQNALVKIHDEKSPLKEADATYETLVQHCRRVQDAGFGQQMHLEALVSMSWAVVHGLATLLVEDALSRPAGMDAEAKTALAGSTLRALSDSLRSAGRHSTPD
jgi:hypothetical protein